MLSGHSIEIKPQVYARIAGAIYLLIIIAGIFGEVFVRGKLVVAGDPSLTAHNIIANELLWRLGIAVDLIMQVCDIPCMLLLYLLLRPVSKNLALLALLFNLVQTAVLVLNKLNLLSAWAMVSRKGYLVNVEQDLSQAIGSLFIDLHGQGFGIGLIFFGFACIIYGYLIFKSVYFPRAIGILMQIAGVCYIINSFLLIINPAFANVLFPFILLPPLFGELSLCLWLLLKGVDLVEWKKKHTDVACSKLRTTVNNIPE